ncbi:MAG: hypothetical protein ACRDNS_27660, partial [Trebonia sp.]
MWRPPSVLGEVVADGPRLAADERAQERVRAGNLASTFAPAISVPGPSPLLIPSAEITTSTSLRPGNDSGLATSA